MAREMNNSANNKLIPSSMAARDNNIIVNNNNNKLVPLSEEQMIDLLPSPGYRFVPTDQELIRYYLRPKIANRSLPRWNVISDRDLYKDEEPAEIFGRRSVNEMYFFTPIKKKYQNGKNIDRVILGKGAWKTQGTKEVYDEAKILMGLKNTLNFVSNKLPGRNEKNISWIMHEYTLVDNEHKIALCRIKRGRGNTISIPGTGGVGGVSPPRYLMGGGEDRVLMGGGEDRVLMGGGVENRMDEEEEDNKLAATAALYKMSANLERRGGVIQPLGIQHLSDSDNSNSNSNEASDSDDDNQHEIDAPIPKDKGKAVADESEPETNYVGSPKRYNRRNNGVIKDNLAPGSSNMLISKPDSSNDNPGFDGPSRTRESLAPNSVVEPTFDTASADDNQGIVPMADPTFKSSRVPLLPIQNDAPIVKVAAHSDDIMKVIGDAYDQIQLAGIAFTSKYRSLENRCENVESRCTELEAELDKMKRELTEKRMVVMEKDWENKTLHDVLRNEKASYKRKLEEFQADSKKTIDNLKAQLQKAKRTKYTKLSDLSPQQVPFDNTPRRNPE